MKFRVAIPACLCLVVVSAPGSLQSGRVQLWGAELEKGFVSLFDGQTLAGWRGYASVDVPDGWVVEEGTLCRQGSGGDLMTVKEYGDFDLRFEWKVEPGGNSGVMFRVSTGDAKPYLSGPEYQVLDDAGHKDGKSPLTSAGSLYALYPTPRGVVKPAGTWNTGRIVIQGNHVRHWLNGQKVVDCQMWDADWNQRHRASKFATWEKFAKNSRGHLVLQDHGDLVWYRNLRIRPLDGETE